MIFYWVKNITVGQLQIRQLQLQTYRKKDSSFIQLSQSLQILWISCTSIPCNPSCPNSAPSEPRQFLPFSALRVSQALLSSARLRHSREQELAVLIQLRLNVREFSEPPDSKTNMAHNVYRIFMLLQGSGYISKSTYRDIQYAVIPERQSCSYMTGWVHVFMAATELSFKLQKRKTIKSFICYEAVGSALNHRAEGKSPLRN